MALEVIKIIRVIRVICVVRVIRAVRVIRVISGRFENKPLRSAALQHPHNRDRIRDYERAKECCVDAFEGRVPLSVTAILSHSSSSSLLLLLPPPPPSPRCAATIAGRPTAPTPSASTSPATTR